MIFNCKADGKTIADQLLEKGISLSLPCGGMGRCGNCKVRVVEGFVEASDRDREVLSEAELNEGWRLACLAVPEREVSVEVIDEASAQIEMLSNEGGELTTESAYDSAGLNAVLADGKGIAIDVGSTTIVAALVSPGKSGNMGDCEVNATGSMNHQCIYGADVISRIKAANEGSLSTLKMLVLKDINRLIKKLGTGDVKRVVISGNTTMMHLLLGDSCEGLGVYPYTPVRLQYPVMKPSDLGLEALGDAEVQIIPGVSAFVGGDIVAGMYQLDFHRIPEGRRVLLVDLGTNGEMALADSEHITVCSTAAGPVFEGGSISCGMAGVAGAIEHVDIDETTGKIRNISVIGNVAAGGICGSGVLELVSELRRCRIIDDTGLLKDEYFAKGYPLCIGEDFGQNRLFFKQEDIRAVQLAKAAIKSGIETLAKAHGCSVGDIDKVYLAGGFSNHITADKVRFLNMFPEELMEEGKMEAVGNTSLLGGIKAVTYGTEAIGEILEKVSEAELASQSEFSEAYIDAMNF